MLKSTVYLVGAGPGDCGLITVRALELIKTADCIIYDYLVNPELLKFKKDGCEIVYAGKKKGAHTLSQDKLNQLLAKKAKIYQRVVRLKGGDPFIFGRGAEEALYLNKKNINFEIVPGISSAIAVPAYAGIPLTERSRTSTVGFITGHEDPAKIESDINWDALAKALGTTVFLMGLGNLGLIAKKLIACGKPKKTPVAIISWGTTPKQKTITGNLENIDKLAKEKTIVSPAIIVVGEVVKLRKELDWFEKRPLFGKRIIVTRARHQLSVLSEKLTALGVEVIEIPVIKIVPLKADKQLSDALSTNKYDWVFFTSQNGVYEFSAFLRRAGRDSRIFAGKKICAIGSETAESLSKIGIRADYVPMLFSSQAMLRHFEGDEFKGSKVLVLRAKEAPDLLPQGLRKAGLAVKVIDLYGTDIETESASKLREVLKLGIDMVTFTSSSTVKNFIKLAGKDYQRKLSGVKIASIGPVTSGTLKEFGLRPSVEAKFFTINGLLEEIIESTHRAIND